MRLGIINYWRSQRELTLCPALGLFAPRTDWKLQSRLIFLQDKGDRPQKSPRRLNAQGFFMGITPLLARPYAAESP
ncbi:hypothetical protein ACQ4M4_07525 [Leptolyngbya sp. AN02str]|uniref:hypothetical protein n=1 Tax=Leptolyngbya sp. AN02str TaxID=3423363 RepID=UPI003D3101E2